MSRKPLAFVTTLLIVVSAVSVLATRPAEAASQATATSVALNSGAGCGNADLDLGVVSGEVDVEYGLATNLFGTVLDEFEHDSSGLDNLGGVFTGYGIDVSPTQPPGTIIGSYAWAGASPPQTATNAEWFVLYQCTLVDNDVLYTCFGDYGTCPQTAAEAMETLFTVNVSTTTPAPGEVVTVESVGCVAEIGPLAAVSLLRDTTAVAGIFPINPDENGAFSVPLTIPADIPVGTALVVRVVCGDGDVVSASRDVSLTVTSPEPPPTEPEPEPTAAPANSTRPRFTG